MKFVTVSQLRLKTTQIIAEIEKSKIKVVVTKNGKPVALIKPIEEKQFRLENNNH